MKKLLPLILILFSVSAFPQTSDLAVGAYSVNGKLISLTNILGLSDCPTRNVAGKAKNIEVNGHLATFRLGKKRENINIEVDLDRISAADRNTMFRHLVTKSNPLRVAGYSCNQDGIISAFSIDRVY